MNERALYHAVMLLLSVHGAINVQRETLGMANSLELHKGREAMCMYVNK